MHISRYKGLHKFVKKILVHTKKLGKSDEKSNLEMATTSEKELSALYKSVEITLRDAEFDIENPPSGILIPKRMNLLKECFLVFDAKASYDKILSIEKDRNILKKELKYIFRMIIENPERAKICLKPIFTKYQIKCETACSFLDSITGTHVYSSEGIGTLTQVFLIFPDVFYSVAKKREKFLRYPNSLKLDGTLYPNFNILHLKIGFISFLPKGKKYGGYVKALLHLNMAIESSNFSEEHLAFFRCLYNSPIISHKKREKWFEGFGIEESDCMLWSKIFDRHFPEHADIHKYFEQNA